MKQHIDLLLIETTGQAQKTPYLSKHRNFLTPLKSVAWSCGSDGWEGPPELSSLLLLKVGQHEFTFPKIHW